MCGKLCFILPFYKKKGSESSDLFGLSCVLSEFDGGYSGHWTAPEL